MNEALQVKVEQEHINAERRGLLRLEHFLVAEFPLELNEGDNLIDVAIKIMKDMRAELARHQASNAVFSQFSRF
jgi:hypothetical protein